MKDTKITIRICTMIRGEQRYFAHRKQYHEARGFGPLTVFVDDPQEMALYEAADKRPVPYEGKGRRMLAFNDYLRESTRCPPAFMHRPQRAIVPCAGPRPRLDPGTDTTLDPGADPSEIRVRQSARKWQWQWKEQMAARPPLRCERRSVPGQGLLHVQPLQQSRKADIPGTGL